MRFPRHARIFRGQLDAAPFAGVFFLMLLFLLLHSSFVFIPGVPIQLPQTVDLPGTVNPTVVVAIDRAGQLYFHNQVISIEDLRGKMQSAVANASDPLTLVLQADQEVKYEVLVRLCLMARETGIKEALLATRPRLSALAGETTRR
jgi:biopolymer transport protein ExbD